MPTVEEVGTVVLRKELQNLYADAWFLRARKHLSWWQPWVGNKGLVVDEDLDDVLVVGEVVLLMLDDVVERVLDEVGLLVLDDVVE
jgi:hypothetical protein